MNNYINIKKYLTALLVLCIIGNVLGQGIPREVTFEPDEGGYPVGYDPVKKIGAFDLSSTATNEPFRHILMLMSRKLPWENTIDYRSLGFKANQGNRAEGNPKFSRHWDINEGSFREAFSVDGQSFGMNPVFLPDPSRTLSAQGQTFTCINAPFPSIKIDNVNEASKFNFFLLTEYEIDRRAKSVANTNFGYLRWDIEGLPYEGWKEILQGRQVWQNGQYRHEINGGTNAKYKNMNDAVFFDFVMDRWRYVFSELIYKTKLYSGSKVWLYGTGPLQPVDAFNKEQFDAAGNISTWWRQPLNSLWAASNNYNQRKLSEEVSYMEPWDNLADIEPFAVLKFDDTNTWQHTDILRLKNNPKNTTISGIPTRYFITDIDGSGPNGSRKVKVSLHSQDGSLRIADRPHKIIYFHWKGYTETTIQPGNSSIEFITTAPSPSDLERDEDRFLVNIWNNLYCYRYIEPKKLGFMNWEPSPRFNMTAPYSLASNDIFNQRVYDTMVAFTNLQNFGMINWDVEMKGRLVPMVYEALALAQKKIAPYKTHIENQTLSYVGVSMDNGSTWLEPGYPTLPFEQRYNGWWMAKRKNTNLPFPMAIATYNSQQKTILIAHLSNVGANNLTYKIKITIPNVGTYTYDISSTKDLKYSLFKL
jgi:hypothetical protein